MSLIDPGIDTGHIKQMALRARNLGSLSREEDAYRAMRNPIPYASNNGDYKSPFLNPNYTSDLMKEIKEFCKDKSADEIHEAMGRKVHYLPNGKKVLSGYGWLRPSNYSFKDVGIDERELIKDVVAIEGDCDLIASNLENLGEIKKIKGRLYIPQNTKLKDISSVESVGCISKGLGSMEDTVKLLKRIKFNPKEIRGVGKLYPQDFITMDILNGVKTTATQALKSLAASKIY